VQAETASESGDVPCARQLKPGERAAVTRRPRRAGPRPGSRSRRSGSTWSRPAARGGLIALAVDTVPSGA